jgi:hypothetical protein
MPTVFPKFALLLLLAGLCRGEPLSAPEAIDRYLARSQRDQCTCADAAYSVSIDATLPKLHKEGTMSGLKVITRTGQAVYRGLRFTGDALVKKAVIARFLAMEAQPPEQVTKFGITRQNYTFEYLASADYQGLRAYVWRLIPKRKRAGLFEGELWLNAATAAPLRLWGDSVRSPSIFVRNMRFVQDYREHATCSEPLRLLVTIETRIAGKAELAVWLHSTGQVQVDQAGAGNRRVD